MLSPKIANKLVQDVSEIKELVSFIKEEIKKLDSTLDIKLDDPITLAVEVKSRQRAIETLLAILSPLLNTQDISSNENEYAVE